MDYHKTMENYLNVKKRIFSACSKAIINIDDSYAEQIMEACDCDIITYSIDKNDSTYSAKNIKHRADGVDFELVGNSVIGRAKLKTPGEFTVYNAMAAGVCAVALGMPFAGVVNALSDVPRVKGRAEVVPT